VRQVQLSRRAAKARGDGGAGSGEVPAAAAA